MRNSAFGPSASPSLPDGTTPPGAALPYRNPAERRVVYAGQLYRWKGVDTLLDAMARCPRRG